MPDPIRKTSPSHGFALAWPIPCAGRSQRKGLSSHCRRRSGTKSQQQKDPGPWAQSHPRATASDFPFSDPIPSYDQDSSSPPPLTTTPSETPRFAAHRVRVMLPLPRLSKLGKHPAPRWEWEPPPRGPLAPNHFRHTFYLLPACCPVKTWLSSCSAHFRQSPAKVIVCEARQPNCPIDRRYPK